MDEIDNIIIRTLITDVECTIDEDSIISLSSFSPELLVETISKCLYLINPTLDLPKTLPKNNIAQRFQVCSSLAEAVKFIGFRGDVGYQTFLYDNVAEIRRVFMFLIEKIQPKDDVDQINLNQKPLDNISKLENEIYRIIKVQLTNPWLPPWVKRTDCLNESVKFKPQINFSVYKPKIDLSVEESSSQLINYRAKRSPNIFQQCSTYTLCPTLINHNDLECYYDKEGNSTVDFKSNQMEINLKKLTEKYEILTNPTSTLKTKTLITTTPQKLIKQDTIEPIRSQNDINLIKSYSPIEETIEKLKQSIDDLLSKRTHIQSELLQLKLDSQQHDKKALELNDSKKVKERSKIILENPEVNISKLESMIANTNDRIKKIKTQMEIHKKPLIKHFEDIKQKTNNQTNQKVLHELKLAREKCNSLRDDIKSKTQLQSLLMNEWQKIDKNTSRNAYTNRLLEIIANIRKQKNDINKVLRDTRELQKEINLITGQLDRQFTVTDDLLFKTAKRDEYSKKAYKFLATLHSDFSELVSSISQTGAILRDIREIEDQIDMEKSHNISLNLEKITFDLKQMQKDSKQLQEKICEIEDELHKK